MIRRLKVHYSGSARRDLERILRQIVSAGGSAETALGFVLRIEERCQKIGDAPRGGRARDDLRLGLRTVPFEHSAVICYLVEDKRVLVTNVFHGGRDVETFFRDPPRD